MLSDTIPKIMRLRNPTLSDLKYKSRVVGGSTGVLQNASTSSHSWQHTKFASEFL